MLKLHGFSLSNFYNMVKHSMLEKDIEFEEVLVRPNQEPEFLAISPMGKIPCLQTEDGCLAETNVIMDYLEDVYPTPGLYPVDPFSRGRAKEIIKMVECYIETPARCHLASVLFGAEQSQSAYDEVRPLVERGLNALKELAVLDPYIMGNEFGYVDIFTLYSFNLASRLMQSVYDWDITAEVPGLDKTFELIRCRDISTQIATEFDQAFDALITQRKQA